MRIDAYNQVAQLYGAQIYHNNDNSHKRDKAASMGGDQISISKAGYSHQVAKTAVSEASDVRADKIAKIKAQIQAGTYSVDPEAFANKLLGNYNAVI